MIQTSTSVVARDPRGSAVSPDQIQQSAGEQFRRDSADRRPLQRTLRWPQDICGSPGRTPLVFRITHGKYLSCDANEGSAWVCWEDLNFIPVIRDHEEGATRSTCRKLARVPTSAIRIHCIGPRSLRLAGDAVHTCRASKLKCAFSVEGHKTQTGERTGRNESGV